jgi:hypothetical protein
VRAHAAAVMALLLPLTACGGSPEPHATPTSPAAGPSDVSTPLPGADWNPCADLAAARVSAALGTEVTKENGNDATPRCAFLPVAEGGPTLNVTYLWYDGSFEEAWDSMGRIRGRVTGLDVPGADAARLVVHTRKKAVLVTGFVQTGELIETVNAIALDPDDRAALVAATRQVLTALARNAPASPKQAERRG